VLGVTKDARANSTYATTQLILNIALTVPVVAVVFAVLRLLPSMHDSTALGVCAAIILIGTQEVVRALNAAGHRWSNVLSSDFAYHGFKLALLAALMLAGSLRLDTVFWAVALAASAGTAVHTFAGAKGRARAPMGFTAVVSRNWNYGKWLLLESIVFIASYSIYLYLVALLVDVESAGAFNAAQTLVNSANVVWMGITGFSIPAARRALIERGLLGWRKYLLDVGVGLVALTAGIGVILSIFARPLLILIFSPQYAQYAHLVPILAFGMVLTVCNSLLGIAFRTLELPRTGFEAKLVSAAVTAITAYPAIKYWGVTGAALGLLLTQFSWLTVYIIKLMALRPVLAEHVAHVLSESNAAESANRP
jgi:O-antigen/teichoic acid export membrane protein